MGPTTRSVKRRQEDEEAEGITEVKEEVQSFRPARKRHHGGTDLKNRTCIICNRVFTKPAHMRNHMAVHDPDRQKYTCPYQDCHAQYNDVKNWRVHFMNHHAHGPQKAKLNQLNKAEQKLKTVNV